MIILLMAALEKRMIVTDSSVLEKTYNKPDLLVYDDVHLTPNNVFQEIGTGLMGYEYYINHNQKQRPEPIPIQASHF